MTLWGIAMMVQLYVAVIVHWLVYQVPGVKKVVDG